MNDTNTNSRSEQDEPQTDRTRPAYLVTRWENGPEWHIVDDKAYESIDDARERRDEVEQDSRHWNVSVDEIEFVPASENSNGE